MFVLGIDPGLTRCGYGVVERGAGSMRAVAAGVIRTSPSDELPVRLAELQLEVRSLIVEYRPAVVAVERVFFQVNVRTAMSVGQASGIALAEAVNAGCAVAQYTPNQVKQAVAGWGAATKDQMELMVRTLLKIEGALQPVDAADALALALTHFAHAGLGVPAVAGSSGARVASVARVPAVVGSPVARR